MSNSIVFKEQTFGRDLSSVSKQFFGSLTYLLSDLDVDRHFGVLMTIEKLNGNATQQCIANKMKIDKVVMVRVMNYLIEKGCIKRVVNTSDRREYFIQLTDRGQKSMKAIHKALDKLWKVMTINISEDELINFYEVLNRLYANLQTLPSHKVIVKYRKAKTHAK